MSGDYDLDRAYEIDGPDGARKLYGEWADTYDSAFGEAWGYVAPKRVAEIFRAEMTEADQPVLDIGAGTGLVAEHLRDLTVDGIDITQAMLDKAGAKGLYRNRILANLLEPLPMEADAYGGFVSCGTFTHGHVGPECFPELLRVARPNALFVCGILPAVLDNLRFGSTLAALVRDEKITPVRFFDIKNYDKDDHPHANDHGLAMVFRTL